MKQAYNDLGAISKLNQTIRVGISNEIVTLLSQQLYQSPLKAIEEVVVEVREQTDQWLKEYQRRMTTQVSGPSNRQRIFVNQKTGNL